MRPHGENELTGQPAAQEAEMDWSQYRHVKDREIRAFDENGAISELQLKRYKGEYYILITLVWQKEPILLHTTRPPTKPRTFVDIRRAILWIDRQISRCNLITLDLNNQ